MARGEQTNRSLSVERAIRPFSASENRKPVYGNKQTRPQRADQTPLIEGNELDAYEERMREREQDRRDYEDYKNSPDYEGR